MLALLALLSPAHATDVVVQYQPPVGRNIFVRFTDVEPATERTVEVPCGKAPVCRLSMTLTPDAEKWRVAVRLDEVRHGLFGAQAETLVAQPSFEVETGEVASFFSGRQGHLVGTDPAVWWEQGIHIQAFVETGVVAVKE